MIKTEQMIRTLRYLAEKHKDDKVGAGETRWSDLCSDIADRLEELQNYKDKAMTM